MKKYFAHITSVFFLSVFILNGMASLLPLFSFDKSPQEIAELLTKTETENSGKEKEEKVPEKELYQHVMNMELPGLIIIGARINAPGQSRDWDNVFLAIFSPPPNIA